MNDLQDALADYVPFEIDGKEYRFAKIDLGMMADFESTMTMRELQRALRALGEKASHEERAALIRDSRSRLSGDPMGAIYSAEGVRLMLYLSLKRHQPEITEDEVGRLIKPHMLTEMKAVLDRLADSGGANDDAGGEADSKN